MIEVNLLINKSFINRDFFICFNSSMINDFLFKSLTKPYKEMKYNVASLSVYTDDGELVKESLSGKFDIYMYHIKRFNPLDDIPKIKELGIFNYTKYKLYESFGYVNTKDDIINFLVYLRAHNLIGQYPYYRKLYELKASEIEDKVKEYIDQIIPLGDFLKMPYIKYKGTLQFDEDVIFLN